MAQDEWQNKGLKYSLRREEYGAARRADVQRAASDRSLTPIERQAAADELAERNARSS